jgi:hypothetical protein
MLLLLFNLTANQFLSCGSATTIIHTKIHILHKITHNEYNTQKSNVFPGRGHGGLWGCVMSRIPHCPDNGLINDR